MKNKKCTKCKEIKLVSEFTKRKTALDGLDCWCRKCKRIKDAAYRKTEQYKISYEKRKKSGQELAKTHRYRKTEKGKKALRRGKEKRAKFWKTPEGKRLAKEQHLQRQYGISLDRHYQLWVNQKGRCDLCGKPVSYKKVHTDHNHISNMLRGLTCHQCNCLLGFAFVDEFGVEILNKAIEYVQHHEPE